ncbi:MAG: hypothetical protein HYX21_01780, partial [Candidatus Yanofskybacteria bacterium]|nr:hypothetical protein [Candidatus Yanofskybacteria bacterium]
MLKLPKIKKLIPIIAIFLFVFLAGNALALEPLVPCGRTDTPACTTCDILVLGKNISDFVLFYLVPALATLFFIYAGFQILLGGGIPSRVQAGQNIFRTTVYGLMIIFLAWLIVNTVLRTVAGDSNIAEEWWKLECKETVKVASSTTTTTTTTTTLIPVPQSLTIGTGNLSNGQINTNYSQTLQATGGKTPYVWSKTTGSLPAGLTLSAGGVISGKP